MAEIDNRHKLIKRIQRISNGFENKLIQLSDWFENKLILGISNWFEDQLNPIVKFLIYLRVPLTVAIAAWYFFTQIDQTIEVYLAIALDRNIPQAVVSTVFVVLLSLVVWFAARSLEKRYKDDYLDKLYKKEKLVSLYKNAPRLLGAIPLGSLAYGTWATQKTLQEVSPPTAKIFLLVWMFSNIVLLGSLFYLLINRIEIKASKYLHSFRSNKKKEGLFGQIFENIFVNIACFVFSLLSLPMILAAKDSRGSFGVIAVFLLLVFSNVGLFSWQIKPESRWTVVRICSIFLLASLAFLGLKMGPTFLPDRLGSISVLAISLTIVVVVFSTIYHWGKRTKIPGITILIGLMLVSSALNLNDNHRFQQISPPEKSVLPLPTLESSFQQWLENRPDRAQFSDKPYPVYIAAAQGGGIYAAYHAATAFTKLTEYFPNFPQHVFAISGVSGGSLGASAFSSLVKVGGISGKSLSQTASKLFSSDLLTPLLTMGLFPDLVQRFIFFPIYDWDRARGLEVAFEQAWDKLSLPNPDNPLRQSFYKHWQPQGKAPALVLNTTVVQTGDRRVISPFQINLPNKENIAENIAIDEPDLDLKLSTAAGLSARFPYFTPVGWYQRSKDKNKLHLADGGYFDNSGIPTALDIGLSLQQLEGNDKTFEIVYLSLIDGPFKESTTQLKSEGLNEVLSPVRALFSARESRSRSAVKLSTFMVNDGMNAPPKNGSKEEPPKYDKFRTLFLEKLGDGVKLPLGWLISKRSRDFIDRQTPDPKVTPCDTKKFQQSFANGRVGMDNNHNLCTIASIGKDLS